MEKRASLGVLKKRPTKRSKRRGLLSYLRTNSYMFGPLIPRSTSHLFPQRTPIFSGTGRREREENGRRLVEKVAEYLKSDSYMYAPIVDTQESKATVAARKTMMDDQSINQSASLIVENHLSNDNRPEISLASHSFGQRETVKHMVHQNCRTYTVSGKQRLNKEFRKVVID